MFKLVFRFLLIMSLTLAQTAAYSSKDDGGGGDEGNRGSGTNNTLNNSTTNRVVQILTDGFAKCVRLPPVYRHDCYRSKYSKATEVLQGGLVYSLAYNELRGIENTLRQVVSENVDPSKKPIRKGLATYKAIKPAAIPQANARTERAMQQAETVLLRATDNRQDHFARIADAVNSNKVLLRSAFLPQAVFRVAWYLFQLRLT